MAASSPPPAAASSSGRLARVRLHDLAPYDGAATPAYGRAVHALSASLTRHGAALLDLPDAHAAILRCALQSARAFFRANDQPAFYLYRAGGSASRTSDDGGGDLVPACMDDAFRCFGEAARAALSAIARHLRLRTNVFDHLLDDTPLPVNEVSSSELLVAYSNQHLHTDHASSTACLGSSVPQVDRGFLVLIASDHPGIEVCDPNGQWYLADGISGPGDLLLLTGRALSHVTAGLRPTSRYRITNETRASLTFRLMPHANAILDCSPIAAAGHCVPQMYQPISASQFMDDLCAEERAVSNHSEAPSESQGSFISEPSLRSVLSDPLSGAFLEDAMVLLCGHSFGGLMLKKVIEMARCTICNGEVDPATLFPNLGIFLTTNFLPRNWHYLCLTCSRTAVSILDIIALRAVATVVKMEDDRRLFHNAALRKHRKEVTERMDVLKSTGGSRGNGELVLDAENPTSPRGVQYPFVVGERVLIMGNRRTPDKFVGKEAVITSQCLNGWYLVKAVDSGESIRLQYRSLKKVSELQLQSEMRLQPLTFLHNKYPSSGS
ncbi:hypothetical protein OsJ_08982 [Oryza sativa Japonica Group]|uniref:PUB 62/63 C-terminal domain-containing protein n=2 Tax=Oryza TaxID=4527 RepID=A3ACZ2_ORYSJ|nr:hypothetical protein OsJ_08982 [Oryza sativa Japonica Group]